MWLRGTMSGLRRHDWCGAALAAVALRWRGERHTSLPPAMRPSAENYGLIVQLDANGNVLRTFQDPEGKYHVATGATVYDGQMYVTSLHEPDLARRAYPDLD